MIRLFTIERVSNKPLRLLQNLSIRLRRWVSGLLLGNLSGTFLNFFRSQKIWDGCLIFFFLFLNEIVSFFSYNKNKFTFLVKNRNALLYSENIIFFIQIRKTGFLFSIFIDAFKVGSLFL